MPDFNEEQFALDRAAAQVREIMARIGQPFPVSCMADGPELYVLSLLADGSDPAWDTRVSIVGTRHFLSQRFDLSNLPPGAILLSGAKAKQFLRQSAREEARYQRERNMNGKN
jgi:hypothetical protein